MKSGEAKDTWLIWDVEADWDIGLDWNIGLDWDLTTPPAQDDAPQSIKVKTADAERRKRTEKGLKSRKFQRTPRTPQNSRKY